MSRNSLSISAVCLLLLLPLLFNPSYGQAHLQNNAPKLIATQLAYKTIIVFPSNWTSAYTTNANDVEIQINSSASVKKVIVPYWSDTPIIASDQVILKILKNTQQPSKLIIQTNSTKVTYSYSILVNGTSAYSDTIYPRMADGRQLMFQHWTDDKEKGTTAFIPSNWSAAIQVIRPYKSMTGFIFFARGPNHALVYVFQPYMPLHLLPDNSLCDSIKLCSGTVPADTIRELSFGNAPVIISNAKSPEQYFNSEILSILRKNLYSYSIVSASSTFALTMDDNSTAFSFMPAYNLFYSFNDQNKQILGRAIVLTRNYTTDDGGGIWNGFIVGIESEDKDFDTIFERGMVTLLTLDFSQKWLDNEKQALLYNANSSNNQELNRISKLMANHTLDDFDIMISTAAHKMVRTYNNTMIGSFMDNITKQNLDLPLFPDTQHWYYDGNSLTGREVGRNPLKVNRLTSLFL